MTTKLRAASFQDSAVTTAKIAADAVTNAKIAADAVTNAKIADDAVQTENVASTVNLGRRNMIINGAMQVAQRSTSSTSTSGIAYHTVDRFNFRGQSTGVFTIAQDTDSPADFYYSTKITVTTPDTAIGGGQRYWVTSYLEGNTVSHLNFGTSSAKTVTLSFYVKSSLTGTFSGGLVNSSFDRAQAFTYTISSANTWERKTVTISGDTSGTWLATTGIGLSVSFDLGAATNRQQSAGAWTASGSVAATGASQVIANNGATWQITGVQLEVGEQATPFEHRSFAEELALCHRYFHRANTVSVAATVGAGVWYATNQVLGDYRFPRMRSTPSASVPATNSLKMYKSGAAIQANTSTPIDNASADGFARFNITPASNGTAGQGSVIQLVSTSDYLDMDAEL